MGKTIRRTFSLMPADLAKIKEIRKTQQIISDSEVVRQAIELMFTKSLIPYYKRGASKLVIQETKEADGAEILRHDAEGLDFDKLTDEQVCEKMGGKVDEKDARCEVPLSSSPWVKSKFPLSKSKDKYSQWMIDPDFGYKQK